MKRIAFFVFIVLSVMGAAAQPPPLRLWYDKPAQIWEEYLPLGNGRLGAMPDGGIVKENIVLNDITLWSGGPQEADKREAYKYLPQIQQLLADGKNREAEEVMSKYFVCEGAGSGLGNGAKKPYGSYEILGNVFIHYDYGKDSSQVRPSSYSRELSLNNAMASTTFTVDNTTYRREYFTSFDDDVIVIKLSCEQSQKINFILAINRPEKFTTKTIGNQLQITGQLTNGTDGNGMKYMVRAQIKTEGGTVVGGDTALQVKGATTAYIYLSAATSYKNKDEVKTSAQILAAALQKPYAVQRKNHITRFQKLFKRAALDFGRSENEMLPTDKRLDAFAAGKADNGLAVLYFQFGRYLLISSTRPGLLPPNLQGLWANTIATPWNGDYHLNINIQMNHFPLEVTNLASLNEPFYTLVKNLVVPGEKTAKAYYNGKGWVAHVITNIWGYTSPGEHYSWGSFNTGSAWLCQMLWNHYEFTGDTVYLRKLYPLLKGSAEFYLSTLLKEPSHGWLVTSPSNSPENPFILPNGKSANVCEGPTMDNQIIRFLFSKTAEAGRLLKTDDALQQDLQKAAAQLPPNQIGNDGRLMEWLKEYKEAEPNHRHVSHLWGLYPGAEITLQGTPALATAARASLEARGDDGTGWSLAWKMNFWARLHDGNRALLLLQKLLKPVKGSGWQTSGGGAYPNLFSSCPPLQIDGNFGGTAGIAEMLLQSSAGYVEVLPALPDEWRTGSFSGLCVRGGAEASAKWVDKKLKSVVLKATMANEFKIKMPKAAISFIKRNRNAYKASVADGLMKIQLQKGDVIEVVFD